MVQVIGAGFGRTGTTSLKLALETLLGGPCHHMLEVPGRPSEVPVWAAGLRGEPIDWADLLAGWAAVVDFPGSAAVDEIAAAFPEAKILLSTRDAEGWWDSADRTIFPVNRDRPEPSELGDMIALVFARVGIDIHDRETSIAAFEAHNRRIRERYAGDRLIEWQPGDGWGPLCEGLGLAEPDEPYPHSNSSAAFAETVAAARRGEIPRNAVPPPV